MLPTKFEQIYFRLIWKDTKKEALYTKILMDFSKIKSIYMHENIFVCDDLSHKILS